MITAAQSPVFLVSGGARGVTAQCVMQLASSYPCRFILLGRSPLTEEPDWAAGCTDESELKKRAMQSIIARGEKPTPVAVQKLSSQVIAQREIRQTLSHLAAARAQTEYISVDITSPNLSQAIAAAVQRTGPITGIIHGAGNLADKLIEKKTERDFETVYAAKVQGLENLLRCVSPAQLQHLVLFSSVAGFYGNAGQADYALANEILNKSAHLIKLHHPNCHVVAINWGPWDSGMVTPELKKAFAQRHISVIPLDVGARMLVNELFSQSGHPRSDAQVIIGSPITPTAAPVTNRLINYRIRRCLSLAANPFLADYVAGDCPALPATVAAAWMINACEQRYLGYKFHQLDQFNVLEGIIFDESQPHSFVVDVQEQSKTEQGIVSEVLIWSELHRGQVDVHYRGQVTIVAELPDSPRLSNFDLSPTYLTPGRQLYQSGVLFQGGSFQGIEQVLNLSPQRLTLQCVAPRLSDAQKGQFRVKTFDPYVADTIYQAILIWMQQFQQGAGLPSEFLSIQQFTMLSPGQSYYLSVEIKSKVETNITADAIAHDIDGNIYFRASHLKVVINKQLDHHFASSVGYIR